MKSVFRNCTAIFLLSLFAQMANTQILLTEFQSMEEINNSAAIWSPTVTPNGLEMYFTYWYETGDWDIFSASRTSTNEHWHPEGPVPSLVNPAQDGKTTFTPDGLTMIFASQRSSVGGWDLWSTSRADLDSAWGEPTLYDDSFATNQNEGYPSMASDGLTMYVGAGWPASNGIWQVTRDSPDDLWSERMGVPGFDGLTNANYPAISHDDLTMVYSRGSGSQDDLWMATRDSTDQPFSDHSLLPDNLNSPNLDAFPFLDSDGSLYFVHNAIPGGSGWRIQKTGPLLEYPFGDINQDVDVSLNDLELLCARISQDRFSEIADLTADGVIDLSDVHLLADLLGIEPGDTDADGDVEFDDFLVLSERYGGSGRGWRRGDFDCNGTVGFVDFLVLAENFTGSAEAASVPEPSSSSWLVFVFFGMLMSRVRS